MVGSAIAWEIDTLDNAFFETDFLAFYLDNLKLTNDLKSLSGKARADRMDELFELVRDGQDETGALRRAVFDEFNAPAGGSGGAR